MPEALAPAVEDLALLVAAAEAGGRVAMGYFGRPLAVTEKADAGGPVSEADFAVNDMLAAMLRGARPSYGWLSEEDPDSPDARAGPRHFVVDPIDGTRAFVDGKDGFSVALAVLEDAVPVAAAVHLPALGGTYAAVLGGGATLDGRPIAPSTCADPDAATAVGARSQFRPEHWPRGAPAARVSFRSSLAWRICLVADGTFDMAVTFRPAWEWDVASGALIAAEAGVRVSDGEGCPLAFNTPGARHPGLVVAPPALHAALIARRLTA